MPEPRNEKEWEIYRRLKEEYKDNPAMLRWIEQARKNKDQRKLGNDRILPQVLEATQFVNEAREKIGLGGFETEISDTASFYASELAAQASNPHAGFVTVKTEEELKDCLLIKIKGKNIGVAITPDGSCCLAYG